MQVASSGRDTAKRILETDLEQAAMMSTTILAAVVYAWIEGFAILTPRYEATQVWWVLGHFSTYSLAMAVLFACITGGFGLLKARSMFTKGKRYFLFTFAGNFPFSWLVEDFAFFWFSPEWRLTDERWTNWFLGGVWILDPWREGVKIWIPNWYWPVLVFWLAMMWYAHRCTVYDNLVKDEIAKEIMPPTDQVPREVVEKKAEPMPEPSSLERTEKAAEKPSKWPAMHPPLTLPTERAKKSTRSPEAEEALKRLRARWLKSDA